MSIAAEIRSGKGEGDENFPVASRLIHPRHRAVILAFYNYVRTADDIADHPALSERDKLGFLDILDAELRGHGDSQPEAVALRRALAERGMPPHHALDMLTAFRMDVTKRRYADWDELIGYCRHSAMPVGRFMLDVHGEDRATWAASDLLCAALQINNHLQDCGKDFRVLDRVYIPLDALAAAGVGVAALGEARAAEPLRRCLRGLAERTETLLGDARPLAAAVRDVRLGLEFSVIQTYAEKIERLLKVHDPLSQRVHLDPPRLLVHGATAIFGESVRRLTRWRPLARRAAGA
jgi:squalene synthase HpnC